MFHTIDFSAKVLHIQMAKQPYIANLSLHRTIKRQRIYAQKVSIANGAKTMFFADVIHSMTATVSFAKLPLILL